jgi:hypothetical protein
VDGVLAGYYAKHAEKAARDGGLSERRLRDWFDKELITAVRSRKPVQRGDEAQFGLNRAALQVLDRAHLIREDYRGGTWWIELTHDRLIDPIRRDNERWRNKNLTTFQRQADLWAKTSGRPDDLLVGGGVLVEGEKLEADGLLTEEDDRAFLRACRARRQAEQQALKERERREQERLEHERRRREQVEREAAERQRLERERQERERQARERERLEREGLENSRRALLWQWGAIVAGVVCILLGLNICFALRQAAAARKLADYPDPR